VKIETFDDKTKRIVDIAAETANNPATIRDAAYMHVLFCQLELPRSNLEGSYFTRTSDDASISISASEVDTCQNKFGLHGVIPRLILVYVCSQATLKKVKEIDICNSETAFMKSVDLNSSGGKNGIRKNLKRQFIHLSKASFELMLFTKNKETYFCGKIFETEPYDSENGKWNKTITLTEAFYNSLISDNNNVPLDRRAIYALQPSAFALDVYFMMAERLHRVVRNNYIVRWKKLREQFGQEYADSKSGRANFKKAFSSALTQVKAVYPNAKVNIVKFGVKIGSSEPPTPKNP
jgi:hypothetical protein